MSTSITRRIVLAARPKGKPQSSDFRLEEMPLPAPGPGQMLLGVQYLSLDPYMRGRMDDRKSYVKPVQLGDAMPGENIARVLASNNPKRKLAWSWELVRAEGALIGVNTSNPNRLVPEALAAGKIAELQGYASIRREVAYGKASRIDLLLEGPGHPICYVEIKNVHLKRAGWAEFPDCVTARGAKHMAELADMVRVGHRAVVVYVIQRGDCERFRVARDLDPGYHRALEAARGAGVEVLCYACDVTEDRIDIAGSLPFHP